MPQPKTDTLLNYVMYKAWLQNITGNWILFFQTFFIIIMTPRKIK